MADDAQYLKYLIPVKQSGWAIAAGYVGLCSILVLPAPLAVILGFVALRGIRKRPNIQGEGRAWFAIIFWWGLHIATLGPDRNRDPLAVRLTLDSARRGEHYCAPKSCRYRTLARVRARA
jgi:hypothetical protein